MYIELREFSLIKIQINMIIVSLVLGAVIAALSFLCVKWYRRAHILVVKNRRLELVNELNELTMNNAPEDDIWYAKLTLIDFDRRHYNG